MKILATGDLHIGRRCASLPSDREAEARFSAAHIWEQVVATALAEEVDVVALTGDVVDRENRFFEAFGPLEKGLRRLADAGIDTVAVAGNHDFDVFPRLARQMRSERFHYLGDKGRWERKVLEREGRPALAVVGWSFPGPYVREDPLEAWNLPRPEGAEADLPAIALLHTELGVRDSRYAPTSLEKLHLRSGIQAWLLGHAHAPQILSHAPGVVLYPGSPLALDGREPGVHGPWLLGFDGRRLVEVRPLPLSATRYETVAVDLDGVRHPEEVEERRNRALREALAGAVEDGGGHLEMLVARLRLTGATSLPREELETLFADIVGRELLSSSTEEGEVAAVVRGVAIETRPALDLDELARATNPAGDLARLLLRLQREEPPEELLRSAADGLRRVRGATPYAGLLAGSRGGPEVSERAGAREHLLAAGFSLLEALVVQQRPGAGGGGVAT